MQSKSKIALGGIALVVCLLLSLWPAAAQQESVPKDHAQIYKRAVASIDTAEKKLSGNYTAEAKALLKESRSLFGILQKEMPDKMKNTELSSTQCDQLDANTKLGDDSSAQGQRLEQSAQEKQKKADSTEAQGNQDVAIKLQQEANRELNLAQKAYLKAEIYHLRNLQIIFASLSR